MLYLSLAHAAKLSEVSGDASLEVAVLSGRGSSSQVKVLFDYVRLDTAL